jgi:hypothetical protein
MHDSAFRVRRGIQPLEHGRGRVNGYRIRFNLEGWPKGKAAPANLCRDPGAAVWGVLYRITRRDLMQKDVDGRPSLRYITLLREGARAHGLPAHCLRFWKASTKHGRRAGSIFPRVERDGKLLRSAHCQERVLLNGDAGEFVQGYRIL